MTNQIKLQIWKSDTEAEQAIILVNDKSIRVCYSLVETNIAILTLTAGFESLGLTVTIERK